MAMDLKSDEQAQNELNIKLKDQPWYQQFLQSQKQDPQRVKLNGDQRKALKNLAAQNGVLLPKGVQFDPSGNVNEQHGFAGQPGWAKAIEIGGALAAGGAFAAPLLAGGGMTAASAAAAPAATEAGIFGSTAATGALGTLGTVGALAKPGMSTLDKIGNILNTTGKAVGAATSAAGQNRLNEDAAAQQAFSSNIVDKARQEAAAATQRDLDRKTLYKSSVARNPMVSEFNTRGPQQLTPEMMEGLSAMEKEALARIKTPQDPFTPFKPKAKSTLEQVGNWSSPILSTLGQVGQFL